jgi:hypothetical protein
VALAVEVTFQTLAQGSGKALASRTVQGHLARIEARLPEHSRVQLDLRFTPPVLPVVGRVDMAGPVAGAVNAAYRAGEFVIGRERIGLWPGQSEPAHHDSLHQTVTIRWVKGQPWDPLVIAVILGVVVAGFLVWQWLTHWQFSREVLTETGKAAGAVGGVLAAGAVDLLLWTGIGFGAFWLLTHEAARKRLGQHLEVVQVLPPRKVY